MVDKILLLKMIINIRKVKMSDIQLKSEIESIIKKSGYNKSKAMFCPIIKIVSMRHKEISQQQLFKVTKSIL